MEPRNTVTDDNGTLPQPPNRDIPNADIQNLEVPQREDDRDDVNDLTDDEKAEKRENAELPPNVGQATEEAAQAPQEKRTRINKTSSRRVHDLFLMASARTRQLASYMEGMGVNEPANPGTIRARYAEVQSLTLQAQGLLDQAAAVASSIKDELEEL